MIEKLLLAVTITFCLNLFLAVRLPNTTTTASSSHLAIAEVGEHRVHPDSLSEQSPSAVFSLCAFLKSGVSQ